MSNDESKPEVSSHRLVNVEEYAHFHANGFLKISKLIGEEDINRLLEWSNDLYYGRRTVPGLDPIFSDTLSQEELNQRIAGSRIHMLHRHDAIAEWALLHPRVLDVVEALIGPDVLALQSMIFFNPPGRGGQGWHQDSFYVRTLPDTLIGAWIALEDVNEENGCLWVAPGSHVEPIYPPLVDRHVSASVGIQDQNTFSDLFSNETASHMNDEVNQLAKVATKYSSPIPIPMQPGDVLFFHSHLLHRSHVNRSQTRLRRSYVCHYCNARSLVPWNRGESFEGVSANHLHILARGDTHLSYESPAFGTTVELRPAMAHQPMAMMGINGDMSPSSIMANEVDENDGIE